MGVITTETVRDWAQSQEDGNYYCEFCLTKMAQTNEKDYYCPNEMCLWDDQITKEEIADDLGIDLEDVF